MQPHEIYLSTSEWLERVLSYTASWSLPPGIIGLLGLVCMVRQSLQVFCVPATSYPGFLWECSFFSLPHHRAFWMTVCVSTLLDFTSLKPNDKVYVLNTHPCPPASWEKFRYSFVIIFSRSSHLHFPAVPRIRWLQVLFFANKISFNYSVS